MIPTIYLELKEALSSRCDEREARAIAFLVLEEGFGVSRLDVYATKLDIFQKKSSSVCKESCSASATASLFSMSWGGPDFAAWI